MHYLATGNGARSRGQGLFLPEGRGRQPREPAHVHEGRLRLARTIRSQTAGHKIHPLLSSVADMLQNRDFYGTEIRNQDDDAVAPGAAAGEARDEAAWCPSASATAQQTCERERRRGPARLPEAAQPEGERGQLRRCHAGARSTSTAPPAERAAQRVLESPTAAKARAPPSRPSSAIAAATLENQLKNNRKIDGEGQLRRKWRGGQVSRARMRSTPGKTRPSGAPALVRDFQQPADRAGAEGVGEGQPDEQKKQLRPMMAKKVRQLQNRTPEERAPLMKRWRQALGVTGGEPEVQPVSNY
jgi:hypothetical protein